MVSKGMLLLTCHGAVWVAAVALALWAGGARAAVRYDTATPYTTHYKYIPMHGGYDDFDSSDPARTPVETTAPQESSRMPVSEFILSALRTALEVVKNMNKQRSASNVVANTTTSTPRRKTRVNSPVGTGREVDEWNSTAVVSGRGFDNSNSTAIVSGRGYDDYSYDEHHDTTTTPKPMKQGRYTDPWAGYYDWIINEGSFKFWSVFQLFTAALLLYACLSAIYYAKFNPILPDYSMEYDDYFLERSVGRKTRSLEPFEMPSGLSWINPRTFQFILDAISNHYEN